jgi:copper(I)-binding protein
MKHSLAILAAAAVLAAVPAASAFAQVAVGDPWVRATVPQQQASGAFMTLTATQPSRLVEARSPVAGVVEIHEMTMDGSVMKMRAIPLLELPAGKPVALKPGGYHVMLMSLNRTLKEGEVVPITLVVETGGKRETLEVKAPVRPLNASSGGGHSHKH